MVSWCFTFVRNLIIISSEHEYIAAMAFFSISNVFNGPQFQNKVNQSYGFCVLSLYICEKFHNNISNAFQLTERTRIHGRIGYVQYWKGNNSKSRQPELPFMDSASPLIVLYICVKFPKNREWTRVQSKNGYFQYLLCSKGRNSKSILTRATIFMFCMFSDGALNLWETS